MTGMQTTPGALLRRTSVTSVRLPRWPLARVLAVLVLGFTAVVAAFPGWFVHYQPLPLHPDRVLQAPGGATLLGTDQYGRSLVGLLVYGARDSVLIGLVSVVVGLFVGGLIGLLAGFAGGVVDTVLMRIVDVLLCFPGILLALLVSAALGASLRNVIIAVAIGQVPEYARVMRGQVLAVRSRLFVEAASAAGVRPRRIVLRHVLPNAIAPVIVVATLGVGHAIVSGATLSFLGVGPQGGIPDWGRLLASGGSYMATAWWISTFPGLVVTLVIVAVNIVGDWLRDRMDVAQ
jgi:peptide/nickel transport system permease protein